MSLQVHSENRRNTIAIPEPAAGNGIAQLVEWAQAAEAAHHLAVRLVDTQFVPAAYRRKPEEATAAILAGAEVGLSPMASLRAFDNIQGTPAPKAITLRAIVQSIGHDIRIDKSTNMEAMVSGRRKGDTNWQTSTWTIDRARQMDLLGKDQWKKQPAAMLIARATAEVCRWVASDAIMGMPYSAEEIRDDGATFESRPAPRRVTAAEVLAAQPISAQPEGDDQADDPEPVSGVPADQDAMPDNRSRAMFALFREAAQFGPALASKDGQLAYIADVIGRRIESRKEIRAAEGEAIIDALRQYIGQEAEQSEPAGDGS